MPRGAGTWQASSACLPHLPRIRRSPYKLPPPPGAGAHRRWRKSPARLVAAAWRWPSRLTAQTCWSAWAVRRCCRRCRRFGIVHPLRQQLDGVGAGRHLPGADEPAPVFGCVRSDQRIDHCCVTAVEDTYAHAAEIPSRILIPKVSHVARPHYRE